MEFATQDYLALVLDGSGLNTEQLATPSNEKSNLFDSNQYFDQDKYEKWLLSKSEMLQHVWLSLCIVRMLQILFQNSSRDEETLIDTNDDTNEPKCLTILKTWFGNILKKRNSKLFNMLFLLNLDFK